MVVPQFRFVLHEKIMYLYSSKVEAYMNPWDMLVFIYKMERSRVARLHIMPRTRTSVVMEAML